MGKSSKKSTPKVEAAPAAANPVKSLKKGIREAEDGMETQMNAKKQKKDMKTEQAVKKEEVQTMDPKEEETTGLDSSDSEEERKDPASKPASISDSSDEDSGDEEVTDEEMGDASPAGKKAPKTPVTPNVQEGSKTLFVGNLPFAVERDDVERFFKDAGEIVEVRLATAEDGRFKGFGHVDFTTTEAAQKALELNGKRLLNREVRLELARERGVSTPNSGKTSNSFQNDGKGQTKTVFVKGFNQSLGEDQIRSALEEHFGSCGDITRISVPTDRESGALKGIAYLDVKDSEAFGKALALSGSEMGGSSLVVEEAKPRGNHEGSGGRNGGRSGGRGRGRGGFGGRGRGRGGFGGRGRGTPNKR